MVKNLPAIQETQVWSLDCYDPLEKGMATNSSILCLENSMDTGAWQTTVHEVTKSSNDWLTNTQRSEATFLVVTFSQTLECTSSVQFSAVTQSCTTLCNLMNRSMPGLPVHHQLLEFTQTHVHQVVIPSSHLVLFHPVFLLPPIPPAPVSFPMSQHFAWDGQSIGVSASAPVLPTNTQDWSLGWTGCISLQSKGLSKIFSNTTV